MNDNFAFGFSPRESFKHGLCIDIYNNFKEIRDNYHDISNLLGIDLYKASFYNDYHQADLQMVCLLVYSYSIYNTLSPYVSGPAKLFGYSQGEFSAIAAGQSMNIKDMVRLVYDLEKIIFANIKTLSGLMIRVIGIDFKKLKEICMYVDPSYKTATIGVILSIDQNIVTGSVDAVSKVAEIAKKEKARFVIKLSNMAFHSPLCLDLQNISQNVFAQYNFEDAQDMIFSCLTGTPWNRGIHIKQSISHQIANTIRWKDLCYNIVKSGVDHVIEIGPGCTISGNMRILYPELRFSWIMSIRDLEDAINQLQFH